MGSTGTAVSDTIAHRGRNSFELYSAGNSNLEIRLTVALVLAGRRWRSALDEALRPLNQSAARMEAPWLPGVVMVTVDEEGNCLDGASAETAADKLTEWGADAIGCNCSAGPATVLSVIERMRKVTSLPRAAMPSCSARRTWCAAAATPDGPRPRT